MTPLLMMLLIAITKLPVDGMTNGFLEVVADTLPNEGYQLIRNQIESAQAASHTHWLLINLAVFCFAGGRLFLTIGEGLNLTLGLPPRFRSVRLFGISSLLPLVYGLLMLAALLLLVVSPVVLHSTIHWLQLERFESFLLHASRWILLVSFLLMLTASIYYFVPARRIPWRLFSPGNLFAVAGWLLVSQGFRFYVDNFGNYHAIYGTLGGVVVVLVWLYLTAGFLFIGGQINGVILDETHQALPSGESSVEVGE